MDIELLKKLCDADGIASNEQEIRDILIENINGKISFDGLGSIIVNHKGNGPNLMFCAHMDEVGFMIKNISDIGMLNLMPIGGVKDSAKSFQSVTITKSDGSKVRGLMNCSYGDDKKVKDIYVDIGLSSAKEVMDAGISIGDMVCFSSKSEMINENVLMAKALDDRVGCYILKEIDKKLKDIEHDNDVYLSFTSSEEVGTRGGKCTTDIVNPDVIFAIDVACAPDLTRNYTNNRKISKGCMIVHYDKTMIPNRKFLKFIKDVATENNIDFQCDMFSGGGTDAGSAHLVNGGKLAIVLGIPLRYCHGSYSMTDLRDVEGLIKLIINIIKSLNKDKYEDVARYL
ncbi:aminopeptidase [Clostridium sp. AL.422]|uniref:aminopeptidase n=1 Tax=Clostridium TaxID=1485 RepID=UPI00293DCBEF|nr:MULTISPECIES: aminopeptidase [unclassified Clostridium]MDV4150366.1 aminopeptidase [Clostridium sp. AL.422]